MLALTLGLVLGAAPSVSLFPDGALRELPRAELLVHLHDVEDELGSVRRELSLTMGGVFAEAAERTAPFVLVSALPLVGLALLVKNLNTGSDFLGNALLISMVAIGAAAVAALVYCVGRVVEHFLLDVPRLADRERQLDGYRARVETMLVPAR